MCCRYYMEMSPKLRPIVEAAQRSKLYQNNIQRIARPLSTQGEVCPDSLVPVLATSRAGEKAVFPMLWGYHLPGDRRREGRLQGGLGDAPLHHPGLLVL